MSTAIGYSISDFFNRFQCYASKLNFFSASNENKKNLLPLFKTHNTFSNHANGFKNKTVAVGQDLSPASIPLSQLALSRLGVARKNLPATPEVRGLMDYLHKSPTAWHATSEALNLCKEKGYTLLKEGESWKGIIQPKGKYVVERNGSSFIAFQVPSKDLQSACVLGAHTDSPGLKLKTHPEKNVDNVTLLCPEVYGGVNPHSWFDRSLGLAGRVIYLNENGEKCSSLIDLGKTIGTVSHLAIHLDRTLGEEHKVNAQDHLPVICWINDKQDQQFNHFEAELRKLVPLTKLISHELFFVPREQHEIVNGNQVHGAKLDNLLGTHASLYALLESEEPENNRLKMVVAWDSEEIGSRTYQGADSDFLDSTLRRITDSIGMTEDAYAVMKAKSGLISVDGAHGRHPNYYAKHEPMHAPKLGEGPVLKFNANQRYSSNSDTAAWIHVAARKAGVPIQEFHVRSDLPCGSTIGNIVAPKIGFRSVDIGAPMLSMHSIREHAHLEDHVNMICLLGNLLSMDLTNQYEKS
ncbi:MAG TPA: M18 family aminopeptidase [Parachlamydiaceae bacterium]|nr:M18 family aminopeptidase [Parachlamydiaceae bacterium]